MIEKRERTVRRAWAVALIFLCLFVNAATVLMLGHYHFPHVSLFRAHRLAEILAVSGVLAWGRNVLNLARRTGIDLARVHRALRYTPLGFYLWGQTFGMWGILAIVNAYVGWFWASHGGPASFEVAYAFSVVACAVSNVGYIVTAANRVWPGVEFIPVFGLWTLRRIASYVGYCGDMALGAVGLYVNCWLLSLPSWPMSVGILVGGTLGLIATVMKYEDRHPFLVAASACYSVGIGAGVILIFAVTF